MKQKVIMVSKFKILNYYVVLKNSTGKRNDIKSEYEISTKYQLTKIV